MKKLMLILEDDWHDDMKEIKARTGASHQFQMRQAAKEWIDKNKAKKEKS